MFDDWTADEMLDFIESGQADPATRAAMESEVIRRQGSLQRWTLPEESEPHYVPRHRRAATSYDEPSRAK